MVLREMVDEDPLTPDRTLETVVDNENSVLVVSEGSD